MPSPPAGLPRAAGHLPWVGMGTWGRRTASSVPAAARHALAVWSGDPRPAPSQRLPQTRRNQ